MTSEISNRQVLSFLIKECSRQECSFRYTIPEGIKDRKTCPKCGAPMINVSQYPGYSDTGLRKNNFSGPDVQPLLDNIRSTYNVGAMFRTADGCGVSHLHLCGITPTPKNPKVVKTSLGAEENVPWTYYRNGVQAAMLMKEQGLQLWALEITPSAKSIFDAINEIPDTQIGLVVGNEISGIDPDILKLCEKSIMIPMQGYKKSLNVAIAFGIAVYYLRQGKVN